MPRSCRRGAALAAQLGMGTHHVWALAALADLELGLGQLDVRARAPARPAGRARLAWDRRRRPLAGARAGGDPRSARRPRHGGDARGRVLRSSERQGPTVAARPGRTLRRPARDPTTSSTRRFGEALAASRADARRLRAGANPPDLRRPPAPRAAARPRPRGAPRGARDLRAARARRRGSSRPAPSSPRPARPPAGATSSTLDQLTPQELQVALLLSSGQTTRAAAAQLFLSPKTVEYHLRHVYQKLGIGSRAELTESLDQHAASQSGRVKRPGWR